MHLFWIFNVFTVISNVIHIISSQNFFSNFKLLQPISFDELVPQPSSSPPKVPGSPQVPHCGFL